MDDKKHPAGHYMSLGIVFGLVIGTGIGVALNNPGMGPAIGVALGAGIGAAWEARAKADGKVRELTPEEKTRVQKKTLWVVGAAILVAIAAVLIFLFVA